MQVSFECPEYTADVSGTGVLRILEAIRCSGRQDEIRLYQVGGLCWEGSCGVSGLGVPRCTANGLGFTPPANHGMYPNGCMHVSQFACLALLVR